MIHSIENISVKMFGLIYRYFNDRVYGVDAYLFGKIPQRTTVSYKRALVILHIGKYYTTSHQPYLD